jgi:4-amino-4-deoxy-L-arabinose transferase-like glycosyltransferase
LTGRALSLAKRHPAAVALAGIFALYALSRLLFLGRLPVFFDESIYIRWSQQALHHGRLLASMTDGKPPLHVWFMVPFIRVLKDPLIAGRLASVTAGGAAVLGMFLTGKELKDWKLGAWAGFFYVVCPFALWYDRVAITEGLLLTLFVFAVYFALRAARTLQLWWIAPLGAAIGLAMLTKGTAELLFLIIPFAYLVRPRAPDEGAVKHPLWLWAAILAGSFVLAIGIFSLLRFSSMYHLMGVRTAITTKGLGEVLSHPFDVFFSNLGTVGGTLFVFVTPVLLVVALGGLALGLSKRWRPAGFLCVWGLAVVLVEALVAKHWMFETILPRFFLSVLPPLLLGAAYAAGEGAGAARRWKPGSGPLRAAVVVLVLLAVLAMPLYVDAMIIADPAAAPLPYWIRVQYITDWPSGWGIAESAHFLAAAAAPGKTVVVGTNIKGIGLPTDGIQMYLEGNRDVKVVPFSMSTEEFPPELRESAGRYPTYVVFNSFPGHEKPPQGWPLRLIKAFPKDGNDSQHLFLEKVEPGPAH